MPTEYGGCCWNWDHAQLAGTDNERFSSLLKKIDGQWVMGNWAELDSIRFCPWCGEKKGE